VTARTAWNDAAPYSPRHASSVRSGRCRHQRRNTACDAQRPTAPGLDPSPLRRSWLTVYWKLNPAPAGA